MGHERDRLAEQFISEQGQVRVDMAELGEQMASYSVLAAPDQQKARQKPPIVFLIGISNDLENMGMLPQEIAYENRNLILVGYPESWNGDVTDAFAKATVEAANYEPHTTFFKKAIEQLKNDQQVKDKIGDFETFDLWGYSAGSVIAAEMLTDQSFGKQVENAALICPTNCIEREKIRDIQLPIVGHQRIHSLSVGLATLVGEQLNNVFRRFKDAPKRNVTNRHDVISNDAMRARKVRTYDAISDKVVRKDPWWERDMQVREGGNITVVSYNQDNMTQSYKGISEIKQNPKLNVIELSGSHQTCLIQPEPLIAAIG